LSKAISNHGELARFRQSKSMVTDAFRCPFWRTSWTALVYWVKKRSASLIVGTVMAVGAGALVSAWTSESGNVKQHIINRTRQIFFPAGMMNLKYSSDPEFKKPRTKTVLRAG
jgi:hypothetical protein